MKKLIIGATGTVGSAIISELSKLQIPAIAATRDPSRHTFPAGIAPITFDYADEEKVRTALAGVDGAFVLAPPGMENQVDHWQRFFSIAKQTGVRHVVLMTAKGATEDTPHGKGEAALKDSGLEWTILRPTFFAQNFATYSGYTIQKENTFYYPAGNGRAAFVDVRDIAAVAAQALANPDKHAGRSYELTGSAALSMEEVAHVLTTVLGRKIRYVDPGEEGYRKALESNRVPPALAGMFTYLYAVVVKNGWASGTSEDIAKVLGRAPIGFEQFVQDYKSVWAEK